MENDEKNVSTKNIKWYHDLFKHLFNQSYFSKQTFPLIYHIGSTSLMATSFGYFSAFFLFSRMIGCQMLDFPCKRCGKQVN